MVGIHFHDIELKREKSYIKSPDWLFSKRTTINPKNTKDNKCFQYPITVAFNHREIGKDSQRISKIRPHINKYNWKDIDFAPEIGDWEKFERNNKNIALNILYAPHNKKEIKLPYQSKYDCKRKNQVVLVMITDNKQWRYTALKSIPTADGHIKPTESLPRLYRGITSNNNGDFLCFGCLHSYRTDNELRKHVRLCDKHDYCDIRMRSEDKSILKYNSGEKSLKAANIFYLDLESLLVKIHPQQNNNLQESYTGRKAIHEACGYSLDLLRSYDENIYSYYRGTDCTKKL